ncbi:MAG TPA: hypothetical protein VKU44_08215 [Terriglobia bacterium]|nr:hypothetical protein [Terriglobia bacterium]
MSDLETKMSGLEAKAWQVCHIFLVLTFPLALLVGVLSLAWRAIEPPPWSAFSVTLGTALLVYSFVAFTIWLTVFRAVTRTSKSQAPSGAGKPATPSASAGEKGDVKPAEDSRPAGSAKPDWDTIIRFVVKLFRALLVLGMLGIALFVSGLAAPPLFFWNSFGKLAGTGLLAALGFFAVGSLLGFLFGLPRSPRPSHASDVPGGAPHQPAAGSPGAASAAPSGPTHAASPANQPAQAGPAPAAATPTQAGGDDKPTDNTNLEEVSDWLTKIIVGLGLVELKGLPDQARRLADFFNNRCGSEFCGGIFLMMGVFFFVIGFISAYVLARVYLKLAIYLTGRLLDQSQLDKVRQEVQEAKQTPSPMSLVQEASRTMSSPAGASEAELQRALALLDQALRDARTDDIKYEAFVERGRVLKRQALMRTGSERTRLLAEALNMVAAAHQLYHQYAAPLYNQACYKALLGSPPSEVAADLKQAFDLNPALRETAKKDEDFSGELRKSAEFMALTGA